MGYNLAFCEWCGEENSLDELEECSGDDCESLFCLHCSDSFPQCTSADCVKFFCPNCAKIELDGDLCVDCVNELCFKENMEAITFTAEDDQLYRELMGEDEIKEVQDQDEIETECLE